MSLIKTLNAIRRLRQITQVLLKEQLGYVIDRMKLGKYALSGKQKEKPMELHQVTLPERLRRVAETLGGTFIKFGQLLSMRYDILPEEYCYEFCKLQDDVPADPFPKVKSIIEEELGKKLG